VAESQHPGFQRTDHKEIDVAVESAKNETGDRIYPIRTRRTNKQPPTLGDFPSLWDIASMQNEKPLVVVLETMDATQVAIVKSLLGRPFSV